MLPESQPRKVAGCAMLGIQKFVSRLTSVKLLKGEFRLIKAGEMAKLEPKVVGPESYDPLAELDALQQAIQAKPAGILISVADASIIQRPIDLAVQKGIPVIAVDSDAFISRRLYFIGTNNLEAGHLGGSRL